MAGRLARNRAAFGRGGLGKAGQRVELGQDADHRPAAAAIAGDESGRHAGDARLDGEARLAQFLLEQRRTPRLLIALFRIVPDRARDLRDLRRACIDRAQQLGMVGGLRLCGGRGEQKSRGNGREQSGFHREVS
jgi:hypothetical protein